MGFKTTQEGEPKTGRGTWQRRPKYPIDAMSVGDAQWVEGAKRRTLRVSLTRWGKRLGMRFTIHDGPGEGLTIWRVE